VIDQSYGFRILITFTLVGKGHSRKLERKSQNMSSVKEEAKKLIDRLPDQVTWDDIMYEFYVKKKIATGIKAVEEGRIVSHEEVKKRFLAK
jgi:predicted transcriptional regulator